MAGLDSSLPFLSKVRGVVGKIKIQEITEDIEVMTRTISEMMHVSSNRSWEPSVLFDAMTRLPFNTEIIFDKIFGRWIFTNEDEDEWSRVTKGYHISGPNFTFVSTESPEQAIVRGLHYYYHIRIKR